MYLEVTFDIWLPTDYLATYDTWFNIFPSLYYDNKQQIQATIRMQEHTGRFAAGISSYSVKGDVCINLVKDTVGAISGLGRDGMQDGEWNR